MAATLEALDVVKLDVGPNEASDLLDVCDREMLAAHGWDWALWTVLDEEPVERAVALCGHPEGAGPAEGWQTARVRCRPDDKKGRTEDSEACASHAGIVYVIGSHFGSKDGPLERQRQFVARFREADALATAANGGKARLEVARDKFRLHRVVNDALAAFGPQLIELEPEAHRQVVRTARRAGRKKGKRWAKRIHDEDAPLNIEGAAFRPDGALLLGLRFPVTREGHPIVVELRGVERLFGDEPGEPEVAGFFVLQTGSPAAPEGVRALRLIDGDLHAITGSLDALDKGSILVEHHPEAGHTQSSHAIAELPPLASVAGAATRLLPVRTLRRFGDLRRIEGLARDPDGRFWYVSDDEDAVRLLRFPDATDARPFDDYDELSVAALRDRLSGLSGPALADVLTYERTHRNRRTAMGAIESALRRLPEG